MQVINLEVTPVTHWNGSGTTTKGFGQASDELYEIVAGGKGVPLKARLVAVDQVGTGTILRFQTYAQSVVLDWGTEEMGFMSTNLNVVPTKNDFEIHCSRKMVIPWKIGETLRRVQFGTSGEVLAIDESPYSRPEMGDAQYKRYVAEKKSGRYFYRYVDNRNAPLIPCEMFLGDGSSPGETIPTQLPGTTPHRPFSHRDGGFDHLILRNGKWYALGHPKGPGGSTVPWVLKKVKR